MKRLVIFDFDGTLADTSPGILACHRHALAMCGKPVPGESVLRDVIGAPLLRSYIETFGFSEEDARRAVQIYRDRYAEKGVFEVLPYDGMGEVLRTLKMRGHLLGVATLKAHCFLEPMFKVLDFVGLFDVWHGMDERDGLTKADLIGECLNDLYVSPGDAVLVGDSIHDKQGAEAAGLSFIGVSYGFGFKQTEVCCHCPKDIVQFL